MSEVKKSPKRSRVSTRQRMETSRRVATVAKWRTRERERKKSDSIRERYHQEKVCLPSFPHPLLSVKPLFQKKAILFYGISLISRHLIAVVAKAIENPL